MSDERLRELERRWKDTGSVQDEAALLAERQRVGELDAAHLRLLAYLGHPAAMVCGLESETHRPGLLRRALNALGDASDGSMAWLNAGRVREAQAWIDGLPSCSNEVVVRAAVGMAEAGLSHEYGWKSYRERLPALALDLITRVEDLQILTGEQARANLAQAAEAYRMFLAGEVPAEEQSVHALGDGLEIELLALKFGDALLWFPYWVAQTPEQGLKALREVAGALLAIRGFGLTTLQSALRAELVPWVLGYSDPVRSRVQARQGRAKITPEDLEE